MAKALSPESRLGQLLDYLKSEMINDVMIFNRTHINHVMEQMKVAKDVYVYNMLQNLEKRGSIIRKKLKDQNGFEISFPKPGTSESQDKKTDTQKTKKRKPRAKKHDVATSEVQTISKSIDQLIDEYRVKTEGIQAEITKLTEEIESRTKIVESRTRTYERMLAMREELVKE